MSEATTNFIKTYGTLIVAIYGVVQVWIIAVWRRFFRSGRLEIYPNSSIELGYSGFGPTIGIFGTLRAMHRDIFVNRITIRLTRSRDMAQHQFEWLAFRSNQIPIGPNQGGTVEIASPFMVSQSQPFRFNILLSDATHRQEMQPALTRITDAWAEVTRAVPDQATPPNFPQLFQNLVRGGRITADWSSLQRLCYWEAGQYTIDLTVETTHPTRTFRIQRRTTISEAEAERLRNNTLVIVAEICGQFNNYQFVYSTIS